MIDNEKVLCSSDASLKCLYSGLTASDVDNINCE